jgi:hypothetical protein
MSGTRDVFSFSWAIEIVSQGLPTYIVAFMVTQTSIAYLPALFDLIVLNEAICAALILQKVNHGRLLELEGKIW